MRTRLAMALLHRLGLRAVLQDNWRRDIDRARDAGRQALRDEVGPLREALASLAHEHRTALRRLRLVEATLERNRADAPLVAEFRSMRTSGDIERHVLAALRTARIVDDPTPHMIVEELLPPAFYELCLKAMPPEEVFTHRDPVKQNFKPRQGHLVPDLADAVWTYFESELVRHTMASAIAGRLEEPIRSHYAALFGEEAARGMIAAGLESSGGRLMIRRPGYFIAPHLDVTRSAVTTLVYFARPGDDARYGTQLFRVHGRTVGAKRSTYYPETDGATCELAVTVPFAPNTALVFLNAGAAHGASIPETAPKETRRYSFQFYVGPRGDALRAAVSQLPPSEQEAWAEI